MGVDLSKYCFSWVVFSFCFLLLNPNDGLGLVNMVVAISLVPEKERNKITKK